MEKYRDYKDWRAYWERRGKGRWKDLRRMSGYSHRLAKLSDRTLRKLVGSIAEKLEIKENDRVLDVGCGAGVITVPLSRCAPKIIGVDASLSMIRYVPNHTPRILGEASRLPFADGSFDKILCHSMFQYFPDPEYARKSVLEMLRVCDRNGIIYIADIPNSAKRTEYEKAKEPETHNLTRLFYERDFFRAFPDAEIFDHELEGYENARFRFNVLIRKI
ncbi:MAG: methyltransferase domain-containing protein [Candidatus Aenigmarchaeota archaeon]|nr:methyltransferase domain-containing protein [Candidatus Aenigmarchaeota archaeon]